MADAQERVWFDDPCMVLCLARAYALASKSLPDGLECLARRDFPRREVGTLDSGPTTGCIPAGW